MAMNDKVRDNVSKAVAMTTSQLANPDEAHGNLAKTWQSYLDDGDDPGSIIAGYVTLTGMLLAKVEKLSGEQAGEVLQDVMRRIHTG